ncbi:ImmA/IrrE family metallo-endopeptidase [Lysinibacillus telephonicus]
MRSTRWKKRFVCAHELGHAIQHPDLNKDMYLLITLANPLVNDI